MLFQILHSTLPEFKILQETGIQVLQLAEPQETATPRKGWPLIPNGNVTFSFTIILSLTKG